MVALQHTIEATLDGELQVRSAAESLASPISPALEGRRVDCLRRTGRLERREAESLTDR